MHRVEDWEWVKWQCASQRCPVEEHSKACGYGYLNLYHSSSRVLCQVVVASAHRQNPVSHQICNNTLQLRLYRRLTCFNGMSEERTDYADVCNQTRPLPFHSDRASVSLPFFFFFLETPSFECHWQRPSARLPLRPQQGGTTRCFSPPAHMTFLGEQNDFVNYMVVIKKILVWIVGLLCILKTILENEWQKIK